MPRIVRGALLQASWTGDKESMIQKHEKYAHEAAKQGAQVMLFQELFYGPYFCQVQDPQYYSLHRAHPRRPDHQADAGPRQGDRAWSSSCRCTKRTSKASGIYYNTAAVIDADGTYLGKYRKTHIPHVKGFWEKFYFRPGQPGLPGVRDGGRQGRRVHLLRPALPGGRPRARPQRRRDGVHPQRHVARPVASTCGASSRSRHAVANGYYVGTINRVGIEEPLGDDDFYGQCYFVDPRGQFVGEIGDAHDEELLVRDLDLDLIEEVRQTWQFYRDRRPDAVRRPCRARESPSPTSSPRMRSGAAAWRGPITVLGAIYLLTPYTPSPPPSAGAPAMKFGFTLKPEHPIERHLALTRRAEAAGFGYGWVFDSHVLWREPIRC